MQTGLKCIIGQLRPRVDLRRYPWEQVESYEKKMDAGPHCPWDLWGVPDC